MKFNFLFLILLVFINSINAFYLKNKTDYLVKFKLEFFPSGKIIKEKDILPGDIVEIRYDEPEKGQTNKLIFSIPQLDNYVLDLFYLNLPDKHENIKLSIVDTIKEIDEVLPFIANPLKQLIMQYASEAPVKIIKDDYQRPIK